MLLLCFRSSRTSQVRSGTVLAAPCIWDILSMNALNISFLGGHARGVTPVPIPNTAVKPSRADDTMTERSWESRTLPGLNKRKALKIEDFGRISPKSG